MDSGIETASFEVVKGVSGDNYVDPEIVSGNILEGEAMDDMKLYRVKINGLTVEAVEPLFTVKESILARLERAEAILSNALIISKEE